MVSVRAENMTSTDTLIALVGHGSPRPTWRAPLDEMVASMGLDPQRVRLAFMEHCEPTLAQLAADWLDAGGRRMLVLPLFLSSGGHVQRDIVGQISDLNEAHPGLEISLLPAFGELDPVRAALASYIADAMAVS